MNGAVVDIPDIVTEAYGIKGQRIAALSGGHINDSWIVEAEQGRFVLQRLSPIFKPEVNLDIQAVTSYLAALGMMTPRLVAGKDGGFWAIDEQSRCWRLMTHVEGQTFQRAATPARCREAGSLLGKFHAAFWEWRYEYRHHRRGVHDTARHMILLRRALQSERNHRFYDRIAPVAEHILSLADSFPDIQLPLRHVHGDPKISNIIFSPAGRALCMIDLDTVAKMPVVYDLGDALRSWCTQSAEDDRDAEFSLPLYQASLAAYRQEMADRLGDEEWQLIPMAVVIVAAELAARFCRDALEESYFGWDRRRFSCASEHNLLRAESQLSLACSAKEQLSVS